MKENMYGLQKFSRQTRIAAVFFTMLMLCMSFCGCMKKADEPVGKVVACVDDLEGAEIGVQLGTVGDTYASDYEGDDAGTKVIRYNKGADAIQALKQNKVDCVIIDEQPAKAFIQNNPELKILEEEFALEDYAICVAKENTDLTLEINDILATLQQDGTIASILDNFIGENAGKSPYVSPEGLTYENGTLTMATNVAFPPYEYYENGVAVGIDVSIAQAIADRMNRQLVVSDMEFDSIIIAVQSGKADIGVAGMTVTEDRLKNINFSDPYTTSKQVIVVKGEEVTQGRTLSERFYQSFIEDARWKYIPKGLGNTLIITIFAGIFGIIIGFALACIRVAYDRNDKKTLLIRIFNMFAKIYLTVFRGTPMMVQLLIIYYVIFASIKVNPLVAAVIAFTLNSAAYVAEAVRAGINAIEIGQFEAGRSLGFTYWQTMCYIILPQAIKNALPAMCNEFIALLKESSIVGYIGLVDLTKAGDIIRSNTYEALFPLVTVGIVYLIIVMILTSLVGKLERRLTKNAR